LPVKFGTSSLNVQKQFQTIENRYYQKNIKKYLQKKDFKESRTTILRTSSDPNNWHFSYSQSLLRQTTRSPLIPVKWRESRFCHFRSHGTFALSWFFSLPIATILAATLGFPTSSSPSNSNFTSRCPHASNSVLCARSLFSSGLLSSTGPSTTPL
jgi:hypothetical protein